MHLKEVLYVHLALKITREPPLRLIFQTNEEQRGRQCKKGKECVGIRET
jgi:hypothetical protein